jgi:aryl-alcohol dehydrogenase-like predicted oxidoreductase
MKKRVHLGMANFQKTYGIVQSPGLGEEESLKILDWGEPFIEILDYAFDYGSLSPVLRQNISRFNVATKLKLENYKRPESIKSIVRAELKKHHLQRWSIIYLRSGPVGQPLDLARVENVIQELVELKKDGYTGKIGFSIYESWEIDFYRNIFEYIDTFQVPVNILNRSFDQFLSSRVEEMGDKEFVARSVFLQGLLMRPIMEIPKKLESLKNSISQVQDLAKSLNISVPKLCLDYVSNLEWVDSIVFGVDSLVEFQRNVSDLHNNCQVISDHELSKIECSAMNSSMLDPRNW